jgi:dipeptidase E
LPQIKELFKEAVASDKPVLFVPYAMPHPFKNEEEYVDLVKKVLEPQGIKIISARDAEDPKTLLDKAGGIFIGGGNTYRLLDELQKTGMLEAISQKIDEGMPYLGSSAGTVIACPTIATTNDMHSRIPQSLNALDKLPFQLNCHFLDDAQFDPKHNGETRTTRIAEYQRENKDVPVLGIREGTALKVEGDKIYLRGNRTARLFKYEKEPVEIDGQGGSKDISRTVCYQRGDVEKS